MMLSTSSICIIKLKLNKMLMRRLWFLVCVVLIQLSCSESAESYSLKAEQGDAEARYNLGNCYFKGEGVKQDYAEAVKWYKK